MFFFHLPALWVESDLFSLLPGWTSFAVISFSALCTVVYIWYVTIVIKIFLSTIIFAVFKEI